MSQKNWNRDIVANLMSKDLNFEAARRLHATRLMEIEELRRALRELPSYEDIYSDEEESIRAKAFSVVTAEYKQNPNDVYRALVSAFAKHSQFNTFLKTKLVEVEILERYMDLLKIIEKNLPPEVKKP